MYMSLLGTLLMALRGRRTRTVRMADRLIFCRSSEYSTILGTQTDTEVKDRKQKKEKMNRTYPFCCYPSDLLA